MRYVIFDTETGGLDPATDAIVSIGAVVWDSALGRLPEPEFYAVVNDTTGRLSPEALRVNGFTAEAIKAGQTPRDAWDGFVRFCQDQFGRERVLLGGHNTGFDVGFLRRLAREANAGGRVDAIFSHRTICTMNTLRFLGLSGWTPPDLGSLVQAVEALRVEKQEAHNALGDARMAADLLTMLVNLVR